ncbi:hypothetical protein [Streptomyces sp. NPDC046197]|uniref:hypothetical protein n=1 Tax=Streptomyces sp. NPDC046197 TaxID=3154337 RepID=UPI0033D88EB8
MIDADTANYIVTTTPGGIVGLAVGVYAVLRDREGGRNPRISRQNCTGPPGQRTDQRRLRLVTILLAYSVPSGAGGSLVGTAAAVLAFPVAGGVWNVDAAEAVAEGA